MRGPARPLAAASALLLAACGGDYSGGTAGGPTPPDGSGTQDCDELFTERVQPRLAFCRTCHVPGGIADVDDGRRFMLSSDANEGIGSLRASWERLGGAAGEGNLILTMPSGTAGRPHSGGTPWPVGSDAYADMAAQLAGFDDPAACQVDGPPVVEERALLGSARGGHAWFAFCEGDGTPAHPVQPDTAALPADPRSLVQPGVDAGRAVHFNFHWKDCHVDPALVRERPHPQTCGELRERRAAGALLMEGYGVPGQASVFAGHAPNGAAAVDADTFNNQWRTWGLPGRPDNYDELVAERAGTGPSPVRNPYPRPGENPNVEADCDGDGDFDGPLDGLGGCGALPYGFLQTRDAGGAFTSVISVNCQVCHSAIVGSPADGPGLGLQYGGGGALIDAGLFASDAFRGGLANGELNPAAALLDRGGLAGRTRGTNGAQIATLTALVGAVTGPAPPADLVQLLTTGLAGGMDTPQWWNVGHRPMKFIDAMTSGDAVRVDLQFFLPLFDQPLLPNPDTGASYAWVERYAQEADTYILSLRAPAWPEGTLGAIDVALAEQGSILFHSKDLWGAGLANPAPRPAAGNGSCASCHGAYAPRFVHDPAYLASPALEGIASYVAPLALIGTDRVRSDAFSESGNTWNAAYHAFYPETRGADAGVPDTNPVDDCTVQNLPDLRGTREIGYAAPPLYGAWASAPYLHNGSVPNLWEVLQPADRKPLWRRWSKPKRADQAGNAAIHMGYDTDLARAYDPQLAGWRYDALTCGAPGTNPYIDCDPGNGANDPLTQALLELLYENFLLGWGLFTLPILTDEDIEARKIYNTRMWSQGNQGHDFGAVLTDAERRAIVEYLKTL